ncbi:MAG TPA: hypothetical protein VIM30_00115 [Candidatus Limnocylindrales bacterium]
MTRRFEERIKDAEVADSAVIEARTRISALTRATNGARPRS